LNIVTRLAAHVADEHEVECETPYAAAKVRSGSFCSTTRCPTVGQCSAGIPYARLYWLHGTSIRKRGNLGFHHSPLYLCHVVLSHRWSREMFLMHEKKREKHALLCSIHSGKPCKGCLRGLPKAPSYMTLLAGCTSSTDCTLEHVVPIQAIHW
jgi:hypothetical protein